MQASAWIKSAIRSGLGLAMLLSAPVLADMRDAEKAEDTARNAFVERFTTFTQDKNVMGKPRSLDGKVNKNGGGKKKKFNQDDGLAYESDLTYHDFAFNTNETEKGSKDGKTPDKVSRLFSFVSGHGALTGAGGSSLLERTVYGLHKAFTKQEEEDAKNGKKEDDKEGVKFRSVFKITTQEVFEDQKTADAAKAAKAAGKEGPEPDKVERFELRDEALKDVVKVGEESFESIRKSGRDKGFEDDANTMPNGVLLRYAAGQATQALWNSTLANLTQRRVNRAIRAGNFPDTPQLSESVPQCEDWAGVAGGVLANVKDEEQRKALTKELERMRDQCKEIQSMPVNAINPRYVPDEKGEFESLKVEGPQKEDAFQRDARNQLEVLAKAGKSLDKVPTNWKYDAGDNKAKVSVVTEDGPPKETEMTVREQLDSYNNQLVEAAKGYQEVMTRIPTLKANPEDILNFQIAPESKSVLDINQMPLSAMEEVGVIGQPGARPAARSYGELLKQSQQ